LFRTYFQLRERCPTCGYRFEREEGFFTGVYLINYSFTAALLFVLVMGYTLWATIGGGGPPLAPVIVVGLVIAVVLPVAAYPVAKTVWAAIDLLLRPLEPVEEAEAILYVDAAGPGTVRPVASASSEEVAMAAENEALVRRFYEDLCNDRKNDLAPELFSADHVMHDPQVPTGRGPEGVVAAVSVYQEGLDGHWRIEDLFSAGDKVVVRWTGSGIHVGEINGIPATGRAIKVDAIAIHRVHDGRIAETWEVWDTLGFLQQLGVVPSAG